MEDIFEFWNRVGASKKVHPDDEPILLDSSVRHGLELKCLPVPFYGPLKTAPIVLLYLNPGFAQQDIDDAESKESQQFWFRQRQGYEPLRSQKNRQKKSWWVSRVKCLGIDPEILRMKVAVIEICPYHSKSFKDWRLISRLPSCRKAVAWAQSHLFTQARNGERVVICFRAAKYWGLTPGADREGTLFAPRTTRGGHLVKGKDRDSIIAASRNILGIPAMCG